jgi:hypothetical protein
MVRSTRITPTPKLCVGEGLFELGVPGSRSLGEMIHADGFAAISCDEGPRHRHIADGSARDAQLRQSARVELEGRCGSREDPVPDGLALICVREWEVNDEPYPAEKGGSIACFWFVVRIARP